MSPSPFKEIAIDMDQRQSVVTVSHRYPSDMSVDQKTFVHTMMRQFQSLGVRPTVISPEPLYLFTRHLSLLQRFVHLPPRDEIYDGVRVIRPRFLALPTTRLPVLKSASAWTLSNFNRAVVQGSRLIEERPSFCYGYHLYPGGLGALRLAERLGVPAVAAFGEYSFDSYEKRLGAEKVRASLAGFSRIVTISEEIRNVCIQRHGVPEDRVKSFPNGADPTVFYPRDRVAMRQKLGLPLDKSIVAFVGQFVDRKGPLRLLEAIKHRPDIGAVFAGSGPMNPMGNQVLFSGVVPNDNLPELLSAADAFVLPTLSEGGACNAIVEAISCGLPIISSNIPVNRDSLDPSMSILIDPVDINGIREAIESLIDDPDRRKAMSLASLKKAESFSLKTRAQGILTWLGCLEGSPVATR